MRTTLALWVVSVQAVLRKAGLVKMRNYCKQSTKSTGFTG